MTRRDYEIIAAGIRCYRYSYWEEAHHPAKDSTRQIVGRVADSVATALAIDNPRFDRDRFLTACGFPRAEEEE